MWKLKLCVEFNGLDIIGHSQHCKAFLYSHAAEIASSSWCKQCTMSLW